MSNRLLSLLTEIENALIANDPTPDGGTWDTSRLINFRQGLARLTLSVRSPVKATATRGTIFLQNFTLADGSHCMKASLAWQGTAATSVYPVYAKPQQTDWQREASLIAAKWLDGQIALPETADLPVVTSDETLLAAAG